MNAPKVEEILTMRVGPVLHKTPEERLFGKSLSEPPIPVVELSGIMGLPRWLSVVPTNELLFLGSLSLNIVHFVFREYRLSR